MPFALFGVADQLGIKGYKIRSFLHIRHFALSQGKHSRKVAVAWVIRAVVVVASR